MRKKPLLLIIPLIILLLVSFAVIPASLAEESYDASTMRLLRHGGTVQIYDVSGLPRFLLDNVRFASGEAMETGEDGSASVSLDDSKIVSLDKLSFVEFMQESDHIRLNLKKGTIFLDVSEKLDENAGLDIQTSTMTVGIRGTIVQVTEEEDPEDPASLITQLGVMEGVTNVTFTDLEGASRLINVSAGQKISIPRKRNAGNTRVNPVVSKLTASDIKPVSREQIFANPSILNRIIQNNPDGENLLQGGAPESDEEHQEPFPADGTWTYNDLVSLVAQSASKLYDGTPLTRPEALVSGLPTGLKIDLKIEGSVTDAGTAKNTVTGWTIYNSTGENVTGHITNVQTTEGDLVVDPAPIYVWTGSAEKVYDGQPLICEDAEIHTIAGHIATDPDWKNSSIITRTALGSEQMIGLAGNTLVHGSNPLTGEIKETTLPAGYALTVSIRSGGTKDTIVYDQVKLSEDTLPMEVVRLYADNPDLLAAACAEAEWDPEKILARAKSSGTALTTENGLKVTGEESGNIVINSTNVRIQVDSDFISYDSRALGGNEAKFSPIRVDKAIRVTATGSQVEIGESKNTCYIDWNGVNPKNYDVRQDLGTLTVLEPEKPQITITANSGEKTYDGEPLEVSTFHATGLPAGWTARAIFSGSRTNVGISYNTISTITIRDENDEVVTDKCSVILNPGTLTVIPAPLTVTTGSAEKTYDGEPLTCDEAYIDGLVNGETATVTATGSQTEVGSSDNTYEITWGSASESNYTVSENLGTLEVKEGDNYNAAITITAGSASAEFSGEPISCGDYEVSGLPDGFEIIVEVSGSQLDVGQGENTVAFYAISKDGEDVTSKFTNVTLVDGTLTVTPMALVFDCGGATYTYGEAISSVSLSCNGSSCSTMVDEAGYLSGEFELSTGDTAILDVYDYPTEGDYAGDYDLRYEVGFDPGDAGNYTISYTNTKATVKKAKVYLKKASETRTYDGYPGPKTTDVIVEGDPYDNVEPRFDYDTEYGPDVGTYQYVSDYWVDYDLEDSYEVDTTSRMGTLTIEPASLSISSEETHFDYDGTEHELIEEDLTISGLAPTDEISVTLSNNKITLVSETVNPSATVNWGSTNSANYQTPTITLGALHVDPAPISIKSESATKTYDGTALTTAATYTITSGQLYGSDSIAITMTGSQTETGTSDNTFEIDTANSVNADCYTITKQYGSLTVNALDNNLNFDFTPLQVSTAEIGFDTTYFRATLTYRGQAITRTSETGYGADGYIAYFSMDNGDLITLQVTGLPTSSSPAGTYTLNFQARVDPGSGGEPRTYTPNYVHTTITKTD